VIALIASAITGKWGLAESYWVISANSVPVGVNSGKRVTWVAG
jgi:hypothetical protein